MSSDDPTICGHANEVPTLCPCPEGCYCKTRTCQMLPSGTPIDLSPEIATISREELDEIRTLFQTELEGLNKQITLLQARATALEAQFAKIEPMVEARASRTEKLVAELQLEMHKMTKAFASKEKVEATTLGEIKGMLKTLLERDK